MCISWKVSFSLTWSHPHSNNGIIQAYKNYHFPPVLSCRGQADLLSATWAYKFFYYSSTSALTSPLPRCTPGKTWVSSCLTPFGCQLNSELLRNVFLDSSVCYSYQHVFSFVGFPDGSEHCSVFFLLSVYHHLKLSLEKGVAIHSSILAWRIPWTEEPGRPVDGVSKSRTWLSD